MAGLLDVLMPRQGLLDPEFEALRRRQALAHGLRTTGRAIQALAFGRPPPAPEPAPNPYDLARWQELRRRREQQDAQASALTNVIGGYDPTTGVNWQTGRQAHGPEHAQTTTDVIMQETSAGMQPVSTGGGQRPGAGLLDVVPTQQDVNPVGGLLTPLQSGLLRAAGPEKASASLLDFAMSPQKPPTIREFKEGDQIVTKRWDSAQQQWAPIGEAPRWSPSEGSSGLTPAQQANNAEIDAARRALLSQAPSAEELERMTAPATATGRTNPDYKEALAQIARRAFQRKVGDDPEFESLYRRYYNAPPPDVPEPQGLGQLESFGAATQTPELLPTPPLPDRRPMAPSQTPPAPDGGRSPVSSFTSTQERPEEARGPVGQVPRDAEGRIDASRLRVGRIYEAGDGTRWRWTGENFVEVR